MNYNIYFIESIKLSTKLGSNKWNARVEKHKTEQNQQETQKEFISPGISKGN